METHSVILTSVFMALEGLFAYSAFLPSIMTIGTFVDTPAKVVHVRQGELVGTAFLLALSAVTAFIMKSPWPAIFGIGAGIVGLGIYEFALRQSPAWVGRADREAA